MLTSISKKFQSAMTGQPSVDDITARFKTMQAELEACAAHHVAVAGFHAEVIETATEAHQKAIEEADRAKSVAGKIAELVG
jgi:hypothetical protein